MLRESLLNMILWQLLNGPNSRLHVAVMSGNPVWFGATKDGGGGVVSPETHVPSHDTGQNVNRFAGPRQRALNSDPRATGKPIWLNAPTLRTSLYQLPDRKHPLQRPWGRRLEGTSKKLLECRDPGKEGVRAGKRIYIFGAKQTPLHHRLGQGKNSVLKPLIKRWGFKVI